MRLISATTFIVTAFIGDNVPPYAIVSHICGADEVSFEDILKSVALCKSKEGFSKIEYSCKQAI
jgi:hypothetical protein